MNSLCRSLALLALCLCATHTVRAENLTIESWRKDDQIFWDKVLIPAFQRKHPDIHVQFQPEEPVGYDSKVEARLTTRRAGDLIFCRPFEPSLRMHEKGYLAPLDQDVLQAFSTQARRPWSTEDGTSTFCLPIAYVIHGLFYNKAIFEQHKLTPPHTHDEFFNLLKRLSQIPDLTPLALGTADLWEATQVVFTGMGAAYWQGEKGRQGLLKGQARFTDPPFVAAWQFLSQLQPYMHPSQGAMSNNDIQLLFATGKAAVFPTGSWDLDFLRNTSFAYKKNIEMGVFKPPVPRAGDRCQLSVHPDFGIGIHRHTRHMAAAQTFLKWLASEEFAQLLTDTLSGYFSLSSHPVKLSDPLSLEMMQWRQECDETIRLNAEIMNRVWPPMEEELWYTNVKVINHELSPQEAAQRIQRLHERNAYLGAPDSSHSGGANATKGTLQPPSPR